MIEEVQEFSIMMEDKKIWCLLIFQRNMEKDCIIPEAKIDFESMNDYPIDFLITMMMKIVMRR